MEFLTIFIVFLGLLTLFWMGLIDLKLWILPNELVAFLAILAVPFHWTIDWAYGDWAFMIVGALVGGGSLWVIRAIANYFYGMETLGLGDVKLMAAVGLWLGAEGVLMALSVGAFCGVFHAILIVGYKKFIQGQTVSMTRMALPAGPGFIVGSLIVAVFMFKELWS
jgi:leader peptidase (prepilin peptidase)/N-methyltransferase